MVVWPGWAGGSGSAVGLGWVVLGGKGAWSKFITYILVNASLILLHFPMISLETKTGTNNQTGIVQFGVH